MWLYAVLFFVGLLLVWVSAWGMEYTNARTISSIGWSIGIAVTSASAAGLLQTCYLRT